MDVPRSGSLKLQIVGVNPEGDPNPDAHTGPALLRFRSEVVVVLSHIIKLFGRLLLRSPKNICKHHNLGAPRAFVLIIVPFFM